MSNGHSGLSCSLMYMVEEYHPVLFRLAEQDRLSRRSFTLCPGWLGARRASPPRDGGAGAAAHCALPQPATRPLAAALRPDAVRAAPSVATGARARRTTRERHVSATTVSATGQQAE